MHRRDRAQPGAGCQVEHPPTRHGLRVLAQVPADREPARPRERPVREGRVRIVRLDLDGVPERQHLVGQVEADLLETRHGTEARVAQDEGTGRGGHHRTLPAVEPQRLGSSSHLSLRPSPDKPTPGEAPGRRAPPHEVARRASARTTGAPPAGSSPGRFCVEAEAADRAILAVRQLAQGCRLDSVLVLSFWQEDSGMHQEAACQRSRRLFWSVTAEKVLLGLHTLRRARALIFAEERAVSPGLFTLRRVQGLHSRSNTRFTMSQQQVCQ